MGTSLYPNQIDNSTSIPVATDGVTPVNADVVNRLRDAIIAIESENGVNPSGTYGTVRARLDALESGGGGGGGGSPLEIQDNGTPVDSSVTTINFTSGATITSPSSGIVDIAISGSGTAAQVQETIAVTAPGQTIFTLSQVPIQASGVMMFLNGSKLEEGVEYSNTPFTTTVTYSGPVSLLITDIVEFWYLFDASIIPATNLQIKNDGTTVDSAVTVIDTVGKLVSSSISAGVVQFEVPVAKARVYLDTSNLSGAASGVDQVITWNNTSSKISATNVSIIGGGTGLSPSKSGLFLIQGQLTIQPTVDSIDNILIKVIHNGSTTVHSMYDSGAVWGVGINRSFNFNFSMDLSSSDTIEVLWQHNGSLLSSTDLIFGDDLSWLSITLI